MMTYLLTMSLIFGILVAGIAVDRLYRNFAARNQQLGPFRAENPNCGDCSGGSGCGDAAACASQTAPVELHRH